MAVSSTRADVPDRLLRLHRRQDQRKPASDKKSLYLALGVDLQGQNDLLGIWVSETEGSAVTLTIFLSPALMA